MLLIGLGYHLIKCLCSSKIIYLALSPLKSWVINWVSKKQGQKKCNLRMCSTYFLQMNHDKCNMLIFRKLSRKTILFLNI